MKKKREKKKLAKCSSHFKLLIDLTLLSQQVNLLSNYRPDIFVTQSKHFFNFISGHFGSPLCTDTGIQQAGNVASY